jgi:hypothetical protein
MMGCLGIPIIEAKRLRPIEETRQPPAMLPDIHFRLQLQCPVSLFDFYFPKS